ncbi:hypothetical protein BDW62DRAFT_203718 [Aspergillus aurantiobrunneus]
MAVYGKIRDYRVQRENPVGASGKKAMVEAAAHISGREVVDPVMHVYLVSNRTLAVVILSPFAALVVPIRAIAIQADDRALGPFFPTSEPLSTVVVSRYVVGGMADYVGDIRDLLANYNHATEMHWVEIPFTMNGSNDAASVTVTQEDGWSSLVI